MIESLEPVWKQLTETYDAVRQTLAQISDSRLHWKPGPEATTVAWMVEHLAGSNVGYSNRIEGSPNRYSRSEEPLDREQLLLLLEKSEQRIT